MRRLLTFTGSGVYEPHVTPSGIFWYRNLDGNPLYGVQVDSPDNARFFATVKVIAGNGELLRLAAQYGTYL